VTGNKPDDPVPLRSLKRSLLGLLVVAAVSGAGAAGYAFGHARPQTPETVTVRATSAPAAYLDDEYTYLGAVRSWPERPKAAAKNPFRGFDQARLVELGRTVCIRAADRDMDFDGMLFVLKLNPHQTYVVITEAIDKLCPSQRKHLKKLRS
jgi:hypothetical protein